MIKQVERASHYWNAVIMGMSGTFILVGMMLVLADSAGRYFFLSPVPGAVEANEMILAYIGFPALVYALFKAQHVRVTLISSRLPQRVRPAAEIFAAVAGIVFCIFLTWGAWDQFWESWRIGEVMSGVVPFPYWLPKLIMPVATFLLTIQFIIIIMRQFDIGSSKKRAG